MKLIIQIPCFNEAETLPQVINDLPTKITGIDEIEYLVIDDGSTDGTAEVARELGAHHVISNSNNRGLAQTFQTGITQCLRAGADIIVNTDGDNQYAGDNIPDLVKPILEGEADITVGDRNTASVPHFSKSKKLMQRVGSSTVRHLSGVDIPDAVSGFRAISRDAAVRLSILSTFSYTIEMLIQAGNDKLLVASVPVKTNNVTRNSRLFSSNRQFIYNAVVTMVRAYAMYRPLRTFFTIGAVLVFIGTIPILRFLYYFVLESSNGHVQSLILGSLLCILGFLTFISGLVADIISRNRLLLQKILVRMRYEELRRLDNSREVSSQNKKTVMRVIDL